MSADLSDNTGDGTTSAAPIPVPGIPNLTITGMPERT